MPWHAHGSNEAKQARRPGDDTEKAIRVALAESGKKSGKYIWRTRGDSRARSKSEAVSEVCREACPSIVVSSFVVLSRSLFARLGEPFIETAGRFYFLGDAAEDGFRLGKCHALLDA